MSLKSNKEVETNKYELEIEISAEAFEAAVEKAYQSKRRTFLFPDLEKARQQERSLKRNTARAFSMRTL